MKNRMYDFLKTIQILANKKEKGCWCCNKEIGTDVDTEMLNIEKMSMEVTNNEENRREVQNDEENIGEEISTEESSKDEFKTDRTNKCERNTEKGSCKEPNDDICRKDEPDIYKCRRDTQNSNNCSRNTVNTEICGTCMPSTGKCKAHTQNINDCSRNTVNTEICGTCMPRTGKCKAHILNSTNCSRYTVNTRKCKIPIQNTEKHRPSVPNIKSVIKPALDTNNCRTSNNHRIPNNYRLPYPSIDRLCESCSKRLTKEFLLLNSMTDNASFFRNTDFSPEHSEHINTIRMVISNIKVLDKDIYDSYLNDFNTVLDLQEYCNLFYTYFHFENLFSDEEIMSLNPDSEPNITKDELKNLLATIIYYYNSNIYHNILHAFDVFFTGIYLLQKYDRKCTKEELIVFSLSLVMHDIGHLGFISKIIEERTDVANYVKDTIIQEYDFSDGTSCDIKIISHGLNERLHIKIIENILIEYFEPSVISKIQRLVLSTDILKNGEYEKYIRSDNDLFLMLIKVSDLANGAKCYEISDKIGRQVYCENNVASNYLRRGRYGRFSLTDITSSCEYLKSPSEKKLIDVNTKDKSTSDKSAKGKIVSDQSAKAIVMDSDGMSDILAKDSVMSDSAVSDSVMSDISASYADKLANGTIRSNNHTEIHKSIRDRPISSIDFLNPKAMCDSHSNDLELITRSMFESKQCYIKNQIWYLNFCISFFKNMHDIFGVIDLVPGTKENLKKFRMMCRFKDNDDTSDE